MSTDRHRSSEIALLTTRRLRHRSTLSALVLAATLGLSACQSSEEKAEDHFASARTLAEAGDVDRAVVELRNVFEFAPEHRDARIFFAELLYDKGDLAGAYGQYQLLVDQHPDAFDGFIQLAEIALSQNDWDRFEANTRAAERLQPDSPVVKALTLALDYRKATEDKNDAGRSRIAEKAVEQRKQLADNPALRRILIDQISLGENPLDALPLLDEALAVQPIDYGLQELKLRLLIEKDDKDAATAQMRNMIALFPTAQNLPPMLLQWYLQQEDVDSAEAFLAERANAADGTVENNIALIEFQQRFRDADKARATLDALIIANEGKPDADLYTSLRASLRFDQGERAEAIAELEGILASATASDQTRRIKTLLAQMLNANGDSARSRILIDEVLTEDPGQVEALINRAAWRIADDRAADAIIDLRAALGQSPNDPRLLALVADAYLRDGSRDLAADSLAQAAQASGSAPDYALRYAAFLREDGRDTLAKTVLFDSWRNNRAHPGLLDALASLAVSSEDWALAAELSATMRNLENDAYAAAADQLDSAILIGQNRLDEGLSLLEARAANSPADTRWISLIVQTQIRREKTEDARRFLDDALARLPEDRDLQHQSAALDVLLSRNVEAITQYRKLLAEDPTDDLAVRSLYSLLQLAGEPQEAEAVLAAGLATNPASADLRWVKASALQQQGDYTGAIAIYEDLYAENSFNVIVANNLASLLTTMRQDPETVARAYNIARRLRGTSVPAFQDTFGRIAHLQGETLEALPYLEAAASGLPQDGSVQFHLGEVYAALGRVDEARERLSAAIALAGNASPPWRSAAEAALDTLDSPQANGTPLAEQPTAGDKTPEDDSLPAPAAQPAENAPAAAPSANP
ncbi:tetratricopeptide repeat protein [Fuscovulum ytuae]|uniref:Tetratricopeptide repeat protein n=1 Tax=Fuscovulum ytuae TaxID=3042299 RepID=A0ABY8Q5S8_9RHOB|nr:tetratricopeptide repeat protein [Fuscovulum sp. YMD61]WGV15941.1 tetratricopeptide repeat protein [Fuscovulum sp. YMD61]